jgi:hypothetical protein
MLDHPQLPVAPPEWGLTEREVELRLEKVS